MGRTLQKKEGCALRNYGRHTHKGMHTYYRHMHIAVGGTQQSGRLAYVQHVLKDILSRFKFIR